MMNYNERAREIKTRIKKKVIKIERKIWRGRDVSRERREREGGIISNTKYGFLADSTTNQQTGGEGGLRLVRGQLKLNWTPQSRLALLTDECNGESPGR
jgi:hypothetical protein